MFDDYETCGTCGYDHEYDGAFAAGAIKKAHEADVDDNEPIGYLINIVSSGDTRWCVVGMCCAKVRAHTDHRVYRVNIIPYSQHCCECQAELVPGGTIRDLFDGS